MAQVPRCPVCGTPLPSDAPEGFCPRCSFSGALQVTRPGLPGPAARIGDSLSAIAHRFGDYELMEEIACGGMGIVYLARQRSRDRIVALKLLLFGAHAATEAMQRFRAAAVAAAALHHPNIVAIHEVGVWHGQHFLSMEYIAGPSLSALIHGQPLSANRAARYVRIIAEAIHYAHAHGVLHCDLKPSNILMDPHDQPHVTDFGLARRLDGSQLSTLELTPTGQVVGSPSYIPPELAVGPGGRLSRRSDVYALGALLFHALTGRPPFVGESTSDIVQQVLTVPPGSPRLLNPGVPRDLAAICLKCLKKDPACRYATAQDLAAALSRFLAGSAAAAQERIQRKAATMRSHRVL